MNETKDNILTRSLDWLCIPSKERPVFLIRLVVFWILMTSILVIDSRQMLGEIAVDKPAPKTIICPRALSFVDNEETEALREKARQNEPAVYISKPGANEQMLKKLDDTLFLFSEFYDKCKLQNTGKSVKELYSETFPNDFVVDYVSFKALLRYPANMADEMKSALKENLAALCKTEIHDDNLEKIKTELKDVIKGWSGTPKVILIKILESCITTNCVIDKAETLRRKELAAQKILPIVKSYQKGQRIIAEGEIVSEYIFNIYGEIKSQLRKNVFKSMVGSMLLLAVFILIGLAYIKLQDANVFIDNVQYKLIAALCFAYLLAVKVVYGISFDTDEEYLFILFSPMATLILLLASTVRNNRIVCFIAFWTGILSFLVTESCHPLLVALIFGSIGGALSWDISFNDKEKEMVTGNNDTGKIGGVVQATHSMRDTIRFTGLNIGIITFISVLAVMFVGSQSASSDSLTKAFVFALCGLVNGAISGIFANGILPNIESYFSFATPTRLLELTSTENLLLRQLREEAPGTYAHSIAVANMASQAAAAVGADPLLTKVCALYHDIGKLKRPEYFTENQQGYNPHDEKTPSMSVMIIRSHIRDGVDLARAKKIPHRVIEVMSQHHGTTLVEYFYNKQKELTPDNVNESQFRYEGLKPQTKEAAILLLADAVEASSRSLDGNLDPNRIKEHVKRIVDHKMKDDDQLGETNLHLGDINTIIDEFVKVLMAANHKRLKYQNQLAEEAAKKEAFDKAVKEKAAEMVAAEKAVERVAEETEKVIAVSEKSGNSKNEQSEKAVNSEKGE